MLGRHSKKHRGSFKNYKGGAELKPYMSKSELIRRYKECQDVPLLAQLNGCTCQDIRRVIGMVGERTTEEKIIDSIERGRSIRDTAKLHGFSERYVSLIKSGFAL